METSKLKGYLGIVLLILTLISCSKGEEKMEIIAYGTPEFEEFVKKAPISLNEAWEIQLKYMKNHSENGFAYNFYKSNVLLFFTVNEFYVFTTKHINNKKLEGYFLSGIWVNSQTGEVFEKNNNNQITAKIGWNKLKQ